LAWGTFHSWRVALSFHTLSILETGIFLRTVLPNCRSMPKSKTTFLLSPSAQSTKGLLSFRLYVMKRYGMVALGLYMKMFQDLYLRRVVGEKMEEEAEGTALKWSTLSRVVLGSRGVQGFVGHPDMLLCDYASRSYSAVRLSGLVRSNVLSSMVRNRPPQITPCIATYDVFQVTYRLHFGLMLSFLELEGLVTDIYPSVKPIRKQITKAQYAEHGRYTQISPTPCGISPFPKPNLQSFWYIHHVPQHRTRISYESCERNQNRSWRYHKTE
jgi:hypothetical protein